MTAWISDRVRWGKKGRTIIGPSVCKRTEPFFPMPLYWDVFVLASLYCAVDLFRWFMARWGCVALYWCYEEVLSVETRIHESYRGLTDHGQKNVRSSTQRLHRCRSHGVGHQEGYLRDKHLNPSQMEQDHHCAVEEDDDRRNLCIEEGHNIMKQCGFIPDSCTNSGMLPDTSSRAVFKTVLSLIMRIGKCKCELINYHTSASLHRTVMSSLRSPPLFFFFKIMQHR